MTVPKSSSVLGDSIWVRVPRNDKQGSPMSLFCSFCSVSLSDENPCLQLQEYSRNRAHLLRHPLWHQRGLPVSASGNVSDRRPLLGSGQTESAQEHASKSKKGWSECPGEEPGAPVAPAGLCPFVPSPPSPQCQTRLGGKLLG